MHRTTHAIVLTLVLIVSGMAMQSHASERHDLPQLALNETTQDKQQKKKKDKRVCKRVAVIGSRIPEKVCRKQSQWDRMAQQSREEVDRSNDGSARNTAGAEI